jgi:hypothetical protein
MTLMELCQTESDYVEALKRVEELYMKPLKVNKIIKDDVFKIIFSDIITVRKVNELFLSNF